MVVVAPYVYALSLSPEGQCYPNWKDKPILEIAVASFFLLSQSIVPVAFSGKSSMSMAITRLCKQKESIKLSKSLIKGSIIRARECSSQWSVPFYLARGLFAIYQLFSKL